MQKDTKLEVIEETELKEKTKSKMREEIKSMFSFNCPNAIGKRSICFNRKKNNQSFLDVSIFECLFSIQKVCVKTCENIRVNLKANFVIQIKYFEDLC